MSTHTTAKPTMRLRWVPRSIMQAADLKLQQAWETMHYNDAQPVKIETEWRDVPVAACERERREDEETAKALDVVERDFSTQG